MYSCKLEWDSEKPLIKIHASFEFNGADVEILDRIHDWGFIRDYLKATEFDRENTRWSSRINDFQRLFNLYLAGSYQRSMLSPTIFKEIYLAKDLNIQSKINLTSEISGTKDRIKLLAESVDLGNLHYFLLTGKIPLRN